MDDLNGVLFKQTDLKFTNSNPLNTQSMKGLIEALHILQLEECL